MTTFRHGGDRHSAKFTRASAAAAKTVVPWRRECQRIDGLIELYRRYIEDARGIGLAFTQAHIAELETRIVQLRARRDELQHRRW